MNQKNSLGLNKCFLDTNDPIELFKNWFNEAERNEPNNHNALSLATSNNKGFPTVRIVLLKKYSNNGFIFYTNLDSQKSLSLKENPKAEMCFYWKSLMRQIRINGNVSKVSDQEADEYYNTRPYESRIGAWASNQSKILKSREELINLINEYKKKYNDEKKVPRPKHWSGWCLIPSSIEFWLGDKFRIHERLRYNKISNDWKKEILYP